MVFKNLSAYGFINKGDAYCFSKDILDGQFRLSVKISADGRVYTNVIDAASNEEYVLHRVPGAVGLFTCSVRGVYEEAMIDIADKCFEPDVFKSVQAREIIAYAQDRYGDSLEYLWNKLPDNAVLRRKDTGKWYCAMLTVSSRKLGIPSDEIVEIIDLRAKPDGILEIVDNRKFFPGWHMNKKSWYTAILDGSVATGELYEKIDQSYLLATK